MTKRLALILFVLITSNNGYARTDFFLAPESVANKGRGNSGLGYDKSLGHGIFFNPANLVHRKEFTLDLVPLNLISSADAINNLGDIPDELDEGSYYETLAPLFTENNRVEALAMPGISWRGFSLVPYYKAGGAQALLQNQIFPTASAGYIHDTGWALGYGHSLNKNLDVGISVIHVKRQAYLVSADALTLTFNENINEVNIEGQATTVNLGVNYKIEKLQLSLGLLNINEPSFWENQIPKDFSAKLPRRVSIGAQYELLPSQAYLFLEGRDIFYDQENINKLSAGVELLPLSWLRLRGGLNQGFFSYGVGVSTSWLKVDFASFEENKYRYGEKKSQHYGLNITLGWNLP